MVLFWRAAVVIYPHVCMEIDIFSRFMAMILKTFNFVA